MGETIHNMRRRGDQPSAADFLQVSSDDQLPREPLNFRSLSSSFFATTELTPAFGARTLTNPAVHSMEIQERTWMSHDGFHEKIRGGKPVFGCSSNGGFWPKKGKNALSFNGD
jgi:hypothetical protein